MTAKTKAATAKPKAEPTDAEVQRLILTELRKLTKHFARVSAPAAVSHFAKTVANVADALPVAAEGGAPVVKRGHDPFTGLPIA